MASPAPSAASKKIKVFVEYLIWLASLVTPLWAPLSLQPVLQPQSSAKADKFLAMIFIGVAFAFWQYIKNKRKSLRTTIIVVSALLLFTSIVLYSTSLSKHTRTCFESEVIIGKVKHDRILTEWPEASPTELLEMHACQPEDVWTSESINQVKSWLIFLFFAWLSLGGATLAMIVSSALDR